MLTYFSIITTLHLYMAVFMRQICHSKLFSFFSQFSFIGVQFFITSCQFLLYREVEFPVLYGRFLLVIYFTHISVYMTIPISQFIPSPTPCVPPLVSVYLFSPSVSLFLPCKRVLLYHFSRFHIYALIYDICFSLSDLLHSV